MSNYQKKMDKLFEGVVKKLDAFNSKAPSALTDKEFKQAQKALLFDCALKMYLQCKGLKEIPKEGVRLCNILGTRAQLKKMHSVEAFTTYVDSLSYRGDASFADRDLNWYVKRIIDDNKIRALLKNPHEKDFEREFFFKEKITIADKEITIEGVDTWKKVLNYN